MSAAAAFSADAPAAGARSSVEVVHTALLACDRASAWRAWMAAAKSGSGPLSIIESVEPVWLVFSAKHVCEAGLTAEERGSVTFVELGEHTHLALRSVVGSSGVPSSVLQRKAEGVWRRRIVEITTSLAGS